MFRIGANIPARSSRIYFFDLLGAGLGAFLFFPLINFLEVTRSLVFLCVMCFLSGVTVLVPKKKVSAFFITILMILPFVLTKMPEIKSYTIDKNKGWEWIPGARPWEHIIIGDHATWSADADQENAFQPGGTDPDSGLFQETSD